MASKAWLEGLRVARRKERVGCRVKAPVQKGVCQSASNAAIAASDKSLVELALSTWGLLKLRSVNYRL